MRRIYMQHRWLRLFCGSYVRSLFGLLLKFFLVDRLPLFVYQFQSSLANPPVPPIRYRCDTCCRVVTTPGKSKVLYISMLEPHFVNLGLICYVQVASR